MPIASIAFKEITCEIIKGPILYSPSSSKIFTCDACGTGIGGVLSQKGHFVAFFSEKLRHQRKVLRQFQSFVVNIVQALLHWRY